MANTCIGGIIYHELNQRFMSPFINGGLLDPDEFLTFCNHMEYYLSLPLDFVPSKYKYPLAVLHGEPGDLTMHFTHYHSEQEAKTKWEERKRRVKWDNLFVLMDGDNCSDEQVRAFESIPVKNKVIITMKDYPEYKSVYAIKRPDYIQGDILKYGLLKESVRWFELFDYVHFFNTGKIRNNALFRNR